MKRLIIPLLLVAAAIFVSCDTQDSEFVNPILPPDPSVCPSFGFYHHHNCTTLNLPTQPDISNAWGFADKLWTKNEIKVTFIGGSGTLHNKVIKYAREWEKYGNIKFLFGSWEVSDCRIAFNCNGHWSYVGTDNLGVPQHKATMNLSLTEFSNEDNFKRVVYHEFGHLLGINHEHQSPVGNIQWDEQKVLDYYLRTQGWNEQQTRQQVLNKYNGDALIKGTTFDRDSIMLYPIDSGLTTNGFSVGWNTEISVGDKIWMEIAYPTEK